MNLRKIIQENINNVIFDKIISESISRIVDSAYFVGGINESGHAKNNYRRSVGRNKNGATMNLAQKKASNQAQKRQQAVNPTAQSAPTNQPGTVKVSPTIIAPTAGQVPPSNNNNQQTQAQQQPQQNTGGGNQQIQQPQANPNQQQTNTGNTTQQNGSGDYSQFASALRQYVGTSGINPNSAGDNDAAKNHINEFNNFIFGVLNAIDSGNIDGTTANAAASGSKSSGMNPYEKDVADKAFDAFGDAVNFVGNTAHDAAHSIPGMDKDELFKGSITAGLNAFNKDHNMTNNMTNKFKWDWYGKNNRNSGSEGKSDASLAGLMGLRGDGNGTYPYLYNEYKQINLGNNNILDSVNGIPQCYTILARLQSELSKNLNQTKQQQNIKPANQKQQTVQQPVQMTPEGFYKKFYNMLSEESQKRLGSAVMKQAQKQNSYDAMDCFEDINTLLVEMCYSIEDKNIDGSTNINTSYPLTVLLGTSPNNVGARVTLPKVNQEYLSHKALFNSIGEIRELMEAMNQLYHQYKK